MILPDAPTPIVRQDPNILVLYGSPKVGKTTALATLPGCLLIDLENGSDYVTALKVKVKDVAEWIELCKLLRATPCKYPILAIDTVSALEDWAEKLATENYKKSSMGINFKGDSVLTLPNGGGYLWLRRAFSQLLDLLDGTTNTLILIAHLREKLLQDQDKNLGKEVSVKDLELTGKIRSIVCALADAIGYVFRSDNKLFVSFKTSEQILCGSRCPHLAGQVLELKWENIFTEPSKSRVVKTAVASPVVIG